VVQNWISPSSSNFCSVPEGTRREKKVIITQQVVVPDYQAQENDIVLEVTQEISPMDPREWTDFGRMLCWHNRYNLGDKQIENQRGLDDVLLDLLDEKFELSEDQKENIRYYADINLLFNAVVKHTKTALLPLYLYDHSGITMSTGIWKFRMMDSARWDWGVVGIIYATEKKIKKEFAVTEITDEVREKAKDRLREEVNTYDLYLRGEVYEYRLYNKETKEDIDSCGGYMEDSIDDLKPDIKSALPEEYEHLADLLESCKY